MNRRSMLFFAASGLAYALGSATAQETSDLERVKAASNDFYAALAIIDNGEAMERVWAHTPYVTFAGPRSRSFLVGWDALKQFLPENNRAFSSRKVSITNAHIHINDNLAWEVGQESGEFTSKDGAVGKVDWLVTNVYEKQPDGRWLIVSHHVQSGPR
jgi:ketosteroid isomerase-like protein